MFAIKEWRNYDNISAAATGGYGVVSVGAL
jgi:hypothetical protein